MVDERTEVERHGYLSAGSLPLPANSVRLVDLVRAPFRPLAWFLAPRLSANAISLTRPLLAVPLIWGLSSSIEPLFLLAIYIAGWTLDILDGLVAELRRQLGFSDDPRLGEVIDAVCDKGYLISILLALGYLGPYIAGVEIFGRGLAWILVLLVFVEFCLLAIHLVTFFAVRHGYRSVFGGKVKVWIQAVGTGCLVYSFPSSSGWPLVAGLLLLCPALVLSLHSVVRKLAWIADAKLA